MPEFGRHSALTALAHTKKRGGANVTVHVMVDADDGTPAVVREVSRFERGAPGPDSRRLRLAEAEG